MKHHVFIALLVVLLTGCQANQLVRVPQGGMPEVRPEISRLVDLGSLAIPAEGELDVREGDGLYIAGEWVAAVGRGLNSSSAKLFLDGKELPILGGIKGGGLIFRVPRDLKFRHKYTVRVETLSGAAETSFEVTNLLVMADPKEDQVLFWRTSGERKQIFEDEYLSLTCRGAGPYSPAASGGVLYMTAAVDKAGHDGLSRFELKTVHLGAKGGPREISSTGFEARYKPLSLVVMAKGSHGFLLTSSELLVFDLSDAAHPKFVKRQDLPVLAADQKRAYRDLVLLESGNGGVALDEASNTLVLIDFSHPVVPVISGTFAQEVSAVNGHAVALAADTNDRERLWLLTGVSAHQIRLKISSLWSDKPAPASSTRASLISFQLKNNILLAGDPINLPEGVLPLGLLSEKNGDILISAVAFEKEKLARSGFSLEGASNFIKGIRDSIFAGRIYRITPQGTVKTEAQSVNILLSMSRIEDSPLIYSAYRLSIRYVPLSVKVNLAVDVLKRQSLKVREMEWKAILPPYKFFQEIMLM